VDEDYLCHSLTNNSTGTVRQLGIRTMMKHIREHMREHREPRTITPPLKTAMTNRERGRRCHLSSLSRIDPKKAAYMHRHGLDLSSSESDDDGDDVEGDAGQTGVCCY
jgi:hypothetical protein